MTDIISFRKDFLYNYRLIRTFGIEPTTFKQNVKLYTTKFKMESITYFCRLNSFDCISKCVSIVSKSSTIQELNGDILHSLITWLVDKLMMNDVDIDSYRNIRKLIETSMYAKYFILLDDDIIKNIVKEDIISNLELIGSIKFWILYDLMQNMNPYELIEKEFHFMLDEFSNTIGPELERLDSEFPYKDVLQYIANLMSNSKHTDTIMNRIAKLTLNLKDKLQERPITDQMLSDIYNYGDLFSLQLHIYTTLISVININVVNLNSIRKLVFGSVESFLKFINDTLFGYYSEMFKYFVIGLMRCN